MKQRTRLQVGTLFSGIGAFEQALKQMKVPHKIVFACDNGERYLKESEEYLRLVTSNMTQQDKDMFIRALYERTGKPNNVRASYEANYGVMGEHWHDDVRFMDGQQYAGQIDILVGGSPCQSFSTYGKKRGLEDARGTLFYDYARVIKEVQPKVFIFENVRGLVVHDGGETWKTMKQIFEGKDFNYEVFGPEILDAQKYGLPQMRKRVFVVGIKKELGIKSFVFPKPIPLMLRVTSVDDEGRPVFLTPSESVPLEYYLPEKGYKWVTEVERNQNKARINRDVIGCQTAVQQMNWSGDFRMEVARPVHYQTPGVYVTKYTGPDERLRKEFGSRDVVVRKLMPEESLRLMGFQDFKIVVDDNTAWRQAGNSIAVPVLKALTNAILEQVFQQKGSSK